MSNNKSSFSLLIVIVLIAFGLVKIPSYFTSSERAYKELDNYLKNKYGEEFVINYMGLRSVNDKKWYEAGIVFPKSYIGTLKENDTYYWGKGFVDVIGLKLEPGDSYGKVLLNESANNFYLPKLKELFGENVLPVLDIKGGYDYTDFQKELQVRNKLISGGIYIFGRVENDEDREKYREEIYKFLSFMKETGTFEYVDLAFYILDERILTKGFEEVKPLLVEKIEKCNNSQEFIEYRERILSQLNDEYNKMTSKQKQEKINNYSKSELREFRNYSYTGYCSIYHTVLRSKKFLENESRLSMYKKLEYDSKKDIKLYNTVKIIFKEYDEKKLYNNEWGD